MEARRIAVLGSGHVGHALATGLLRHGHAVTMGTRDAQQEKVRAFLDETGAAGRVASYADAVREAELVFLCVPGRVAEETAQALGAELLAGRVVVDVTNVVKRADGRMALLWGIEDSNAERIQRVAPEARVVKAFNTVGSRQMIDPRVEGGPPTMPLCGNDAAAKDAIAELLRDVGWEPADLGGIESASLLEAMALVWMQYGATQNTGGTHAFKILRAAEG